MGWSLLSGPAWMWLFLFSYVNVSMEQLNFLWWSGILCMHILTESFSVRGSGVYLPR